MDCTMALRSAPGRTGVMRLPFGARSGGNERDDVLHAASITKFVADDDALGLARLQPCAQIAIALTTERRHGSSKLVCCGGA